MQVELNTNLIDLKEKYDESILAGGTIVVTPQLDMNYWLFRVKLCKDQAVVAFPKFCNLGIGFAVEEDGNTNLNLPFGSPAKAICEHIWKNRRYEEITKEQVIKAIKLLQERCAEYMEKEGGLWCQQ